ncbi:hypothetical protein C8Q80DRAFT_1205602, partial [Daedaleopsis nitida]
MGAVSSPFLETLRVEGFECRTDVLGNTLHHLCTILHSRFRRTLSELVASLYGVGPSVGQEGLLAEALEPVARIRGMRNVRVSLAPQGECLTMCEQDLRDMVEGSLALVPRLEVAPLSCHQC